jgi:hypothetical protein
MIFLAPFGRLRRSFLAPPIFFPIGLSVALTSIAGAKEPAADGCIRYWGEARFGGVGYNHLVHVANSCAASADCVVSTDVSPSAQAIEVAGNSEVLVNTFLDSPARTFTPRVKCTIRS